MNLALHLVRQRQQRPAHPAVRFGQESLTYAELEERVARLAGWLSAQGLCPGDRVGIVQRNSPRLLETLLAAFYGGFCAVPVNARSTAHEAGQVLADAEVAAVVHDAEYTEHAETVRDVVRLDTDDMPHALTAAPAPLASVERDTLAWLFYTSGTTGHPKGVALTHHNLLAMIMAYLADVRRTAPEHTVLHAAPLTHGGGLYALPAIVGGATQVITTSTSYEPDEVLRTIQEYKATDIAFLAPTMVKWLVEAQEAKGYDVSSLEHVVYGGAPMYRDDLAAALATLGPVFTQIFGQAEAPVTISRLTRADHRLALAENPALLTSAGRPYTSVEVAVSAEGEILARGDVVMRGYWRNEEATMEALREGWLHTGDLGTIDENGFIYLLDRSKDMIVSGGTNIYPREVEEVLLEHSAVRQVAVFGAPDPEWGEQVVAVIALHDGRSPDEVVPELDSLCRNRLAGYKRPRRYDSLPTLPVNSYGKIVKRALRESYWQGQERRI